MKKSQRPKNLKFLRVLWVSLAALSGVPIGTGIYVFYYGEGLSYLKDDPKACLNCHVMKPQYDFWISGPHRNSATCNQCHSPHHLIGKYASKALNGFLHSWAFSTDRFQEPIQIKGYNRRIVENACRHCHEGLIEHFDVRQNCLHCHSGIGH